MDVFLNALFIFILTAWLFFFDVTSHVTGHVITSEESKITCWTCPNMENNEECNDWAPDRMCPIDQTVCQTLHKFNVITGESLKVDKRCVLPTECASDHVGCHVQGNDKVCVSCCNQSYCNKESPHSNVTAIRLSVTVLASSVSNTSFHWTISVMGAMCAVVFRS